MVKHSNALWLCRGKKDELMRWLARCGYDSQTKIAREMVAERVYKDAKSAKKHLSSFLNEAEPLPNKAVSVFYKIVEYNGLMAELFVSRTMAYGIMKRTFFLDEDGEQKKRDKLLEVGVEEIKRLYQSAPDKVRDEIIIAGLEKIIHSF